MPILHVVVRSEGAEQVLEHEDGALEFGRGPVRDVARCLLTDPYVSRDQLRVQVGAGARLLVENLSHTSPARLPDGRVLTTGASFEIDLPARIDVGQTQIELSLPPSAVTERLAPAPAEAARTFVEPRTPPPAPPASAVPGIQTLGELAEALSAPVALSALGQAPAPEKLVHWFETLVSVQQAAATSAEFLEATARAVVDLVGLDRGMVLLRSDPEWRVAASAGAAAGGRSPYSSSVLAEVLRLQRTVFRNLGPEAMTASLVGIDTVVAAPILNDQRGIIGVVYGARSLRPEAPPPQISPLEALVVQVLAAAVGAGLEREEARERALRSQVQFEQFFSPQLARELAADASLLEGREREVTMLFSDVRNFSRIAEQLGAQRTFTLMQELMELQSVHIRETDGVVVDYVGDGLLAMWNAPADQPEHPERACRAAVGFLAELPALSRRWEKEAGETLRLGVGIHTGPALVGNTGSKVKFKYGPMGPAVNLASRLENATKTLGVGAIISSATRERLPPAFATRRLGDLRVQGFTDAVGVFELSPGEATTEWQQQRDTFEQALAHFEAQNWGKACELLVGLLGRGEGYDLPSLQLLSRAVECLRSRPDPFDPAMNVQKQA